MPRTLDYARQQTSGGPRLDVCVIIAVWATACLPFLAILGDVLRGLANLLTALAAAIAVIAAIIGIVRTSTFRGIRIVTVHRPTYGTGLAAACLIIGGLVLLANLMPTYSGRSPKAAAMVKCGFNLRQIGFAARQYAQLYGEFPSDFETLIELTDLSAESLVCPHHDLPRGQRGLTYSYVPLMHGLTPASPPDLVAAICPSYLHQNDGGNVLYADGSVRFERHDLLPILLGEQFARPSTRPVGQVDDGLSDREDPGAGATDWPHSDADNQCRWRIAAQPGRHSLRHISTRGNRVRWRQRHGLPAADGGSYRGTAVRPPAELFRVAWCF